MKSGQHVQLKMAQQLKGFTSVQCTEDKLQLVLQSHANMETCTAWLQCVVKPKPNGSELKVCHTRCKVTNFHIFTLLFYACNLNRATPQRPTAFLQVLSAMHRQRPASFAWVRSTQTWPVALVNGWFSGRVFLLNPNGWSHCKMFQIWFIFRMVIEYSLHKSTRNTSNVEEASRVCCGPD